MNKLVKALVLVLCVVALVGGSVAGTLAWLAMKTEAVTNTFTAGNINIELTDAIKSPEKIVPGATYGWAPQVTVQGGSEACYLFIKFDGSISQPALTDGEGAVSKGDITLLISDYLSCTVTSGWTRMESVTDANVYYCTVTEQEANTGTSISIPVTIDAKTDRTKHDYDALGGCNLVLSITAYAVQQTGMVPTKDENDVVIKTAVQMAWDIAKTLDNPTPTT